MPYSEMDGRFIYPRDLSSPWKEGGKPKEGPAIDPQPALRKGVRRECAISWLDSEEVHWNQLKRQRLVGLVVWFIVAIGILPGGRRSRDWSARRVLLTGLTMTLAVTMVLATAVLYALSYQLNGFFIKLSSMSIVQEMVYLASLVTCSFCVLFSYWWKQNQLSVCLDRFHLVLRGRCSAWKISVKALLVIGSSLYNTIYFLKFYYTMVSGVFSHAAAVAFAVSFLWVNVLITSSQFIYVVLGSMIRNSFSACNEWLARALVDPELGLKVLDVYRLQGRLRKLHEEMAVALKVPMLFVHFYNVIMIICCAFFGIIMIAEVIPAIMNGLSIVLIITAMAITGHIADAIKNEAAAPITTLTQTDQEFRSALGPSHTWSEYPFLEALYKLAEQPVNFEVCSLFCLSKANILHMLGAAATYIVILLQFNTSVSCA